MLAQLNQQLSWQALPGPPPIPDVDQLSGVGKKHFGTLFVSLNIWSTDCDAGLTVKQHLVGYLRLPVLCVCVSLV